jgi:methyltransferase (TIGR00027 family)
VRQYVVLGAGLDTFAYRNPYRDAGLQVFEVDHPGTLRWKRQLLTGAHIDVPAAVTFVPADFEREDLGGALRQAGFQVDQAACVGWMGVTMYLTVDAVLATLRTVGDFAAGSCVCFDYRVPAQGRAAHGQRRSVHLREHLRCHTPHLRLVRNPDHGPPAGFPNGSAVDGRGSKPLIEGASASRGRQS